VWADSRRVEVLDVQCGHDQVQRAREFGGHAQSGAGLHHDVELCQAVRGVDGLARWYYAVGANGGMRTRTPDEQRRMTLRNGEDCRRCGSCA
jgi:hypothetical protein